MCRDVDFGSSLIRAVSLIAGAPMLQSILTREVSVKRVIVPTPKFARAPSVRSPGARFVCAALGVLGVALGATEAAGAAAMLPPGIHSTRYGIHVGQVFDYATPDPAALRGVDILWGASKPTGPGSIYRTFYATFDRDDTGQTLTWWQQHHPDWIEYRCDRTTLAYEYGQTNEVPLDIANPAVRDAQWQNEMMPALARGYRGIAVDNLALNNPYQRCGHFNAAGSWVAQYSATNNAQYRKDAIAWTTAMRVRVHRDFPGHTLGINFHYDTSSPAADNISLMLAPDIVFDEGGFTNYGVPGRHVTTPDEWHDVVGAIDTVQRAGRCYAENNEEPQTSEAIPRTERLWAVANYLLTKSRCTWIAINGHTSDGSQDYGRPLPYPEYSIAIGFPLQPRHRQDSIWVRRFSHGLAAVNPTDRSAPLRLPPGHWHDTTGHAVPRNLRITPDTGTVLLSSATAPSQ